MTHHGSEHHGLVYPDPETPPTPAGRAAQTPPYAALMAQRLDDRQAARLEAAPLTYEAVGATATSPPAGWHSFSHSRVLRRTDLSALADELLTWQVQERSGLRAAASTERIGEGTVVVLRLGLGPLSLRIPCRVIDVVDTDEEVSFTYGTLPGHPERGEERFALHRLPDGSVRMTVTAFSRPGSLLARLGGPATRAFQAFMARRYLVSLDR